MRTKIQLVLGGKTYNVLSLQGEEAISLPFSFQVVVLAEAANFLFQTGQLSLCINGFERQITGIITQCETNLFDTQGRQRVSLTLEPRLVLTKLCSGARVFLEQSVSDIIQKLLIAVGYSENQLQFNLYNSYEKKSYVLQIPGESNFEFLQRLLIRAGIFYRFTNDNLHFFDDNTLSPFIAENFSYSPVSGLMPTTNYYFFHLENVAQWVNSNIGIIDHNEMHPSLKIVAATQNAVSHYGFGAKHLAAVNQLALTQQQAQKNSAGELIGSSFCATLCAGSSLHLQQNDYLITKVLHRVAQNIESQGENVVYSNRVTLLPRRNPLQFTLPPHPPLPPIFHAHIESATAKAFLDDHGRYRLRHCFDRSTSPITEASPPLLRIASYGGDPNESQMPPVGLHAPLYHGAEVLVSCVDGNPDRPIVLATVPNAQQNSPVNALNNSQHRFVTIADNEMLMNDTAQQEKIQLRTRDAKNLLEMNAHANEHSLTMQSREGGIHWQAAESGEAVNDDTAMENIGKQRLQNVAQNFQTQAQEIHMQAATQHACNATQNLQLAAGNNLESASNGCELSAENIALLINGEHAALQTTGGSVMQSGKSLTLLGNSKGAMQVSNSGAAVRLTADGNIELFGNFVHALSDANVVMQGKVNYLDGTGTALTPPFVPQPVPVGKIADLEKEKDNTDEEEFKLFVATVYGEAVKSRRVDGERAYSSSVAWQAVASVIINRVNTYPYKHGGHPHSVREVIEKTRFDAYDQKIKPFTDAMNFMNAHPGWVENHKEYKNILNIPTDLLSLRNAIANIYLEKIPTTSATDYFSPITQDWMHKHSSSHYSKSADDVQNHYRTAGYKRVYVLGLLPTDDFEFYVKE